MDFPSGQPSDLVDLIGRYPLAWLVTTGEAFAATPLPLIAETGDDGAVVALVGHCSRRNAQVDHLRRDPRAFALFCGPQSYISPALVSRPHWAPTWNFAVAILALEVELLEDGTEDAVRRLTDQVEADRARPWRIEDAGERLPMLVSRVIGFRGRVIASDVRLKLGQDEDDVTLGEIVAGLGDGDLAAWMTRLNETRLRHPERPEQTATVGTSRIFDDPAAKGKMT